MHFIVLQLPEASFDLVEKTIAPISEKYPIFVLLCVLPLVWELSALSIALTFTSLERMRKKKQLSLVETCRDVGKRLPQLLVSSFFVAIVVLLGLSSLVLPGIYLMSIYLFVPFYALIGPQGSSTAYLSLSTRLARKHIWTTLILVVCIFGLDLLIYLLGETIGTFAGGISLSPLLQTCILTTIKIILSLITSAAINVGVSYFFVEISSTSEATR